MKLHIIDAILSNVPSCRQATISGSKLWQFINEQEKQFLDQTTFVLGACTKGEMSKNVKPPRPVWSSAQPSS